MFQHYVGPGIKWSYFYILVLHIQPQPRLLSTLIYSPILLLWLMGSRFSVSILYYFDYRQIQDLLFFASVDFLVAMSIP